MKATIAAAATATILIAAPVSAHEGMMMPGMDMSTPAPAKPKTAAKPKPKPKPAPKAPALPAEAAPQAAAPAPEATPVEAPTPEAAPPPMAIPDMNMDMPMGGDHGGHGGDHAMQMKGLFGGYAMNRDASGTAWQPDAAPHDGAHMMMGDWMFMGHVLLNGVYDWQGGPRGDEKAFVNGMIMGAARRDFDYGGVLNFRAMLAPDPFMGKSGYPLLLQAGETADGQTLLRDRQHPHDLFMEMSASYTHPLTEQDSVFVYAGLPGEPAFGPPAFMHRITAMDSPEAPLSHHWFDSTHVTFGVVTLGWVHNNWKIEASTFRGREPDEDRYDIESPRLDSESVRVSWNPTERVALQASWADISSPEALHPDEDETRWSASAMYTLPLSGGGTLSAMAAYAQKDHGHDPLEAWIFETAWKPNDQWTVFGRAENLDNSELNPLSEDIRNFSKISAGAVRDFAVREHVTLGIGAIASRVFVPDSLSALYDGDQNGAMAFVRLKVQ